jgi:hypothetical protein
MSGGQRCLIRDLGLVKGGKGLRHHEVVLELSLRGMFRFVVANVRNRRTGNDVSGQTEAADLAPSRSSLLET